MELRFGNTINRRDLAEIEALTGAKINESWTKSLENEVTNFHDAAKPTLTKVFHQLWAELKSYYPDDITADMVAHNDLYGVNLILGEDNSLVGIIDFSDIGMADIYCELKDTFLMGQHTMQSSIEEYQRLSGLEINPGLVLIWAQLTEMRKLWKHKSKRDISKKAARYVKEWYPDEDWSEL